ncbi:hypothetical protein BH18ACT4_BH18ACT4_06240 [soil metagenome]
MLDTQYKLAGNTLSVANAVVTDPLVVVFGGLAFTNDVATTVRCGADELVLPVGARIQRATFTVTVAAPGRARIVDVAQVRTSAGETSGSATGIVVDFRSMRTVADLNLGLSTLQSIAPWMGNKFGDAVSPAGFTEIQAERLLLVFSSSTSVDTVADGTVSLPTPPHTAELLVNGQRSWLRVIDAAAPRSDDLDLSETVELTAAVQSSLDLHGGVEVVLQTSSHAQLSLEPTLEFLRTHTVAFSTGVGRSVEALSEGEYPFDVPLNPAPGEPPVTTWQIQTVEMRVRGEIGPARVDPPVGPELVGEAELVVAPGRTLVADLAPGSVDRFVTVTGLRLPLAAGSTAEVAGELMHGGALQPLTLTPGALTPGAEAAADAYVTLALAEPWKVTPGVPTQLVLRATRGEAIWSLAAGTAATVRWRAPNGAARALSTVPELGPVQAALRLVGEADPAAPIEALEVGVVGTEAGVRFTPTATEANVTLNLVPPLQPGTQAGVGADVLGLRLIVAAAGSYTFDQIRLLYRSTLDGGVT